MDIVLVIFVLVVAGVILYFLQGAPFVDAQMKVIIRWVIIFVLVLFLLEQVAAFLGINFGGHLTLK